MDISHEKTCNVNVVYVRHAYPVKTVRVVCVIYIPGQDHILKVTSMHQTGNSAAMLHFHLYNNLSV